MPRPIANPDTNPFPQHARRHWQCVSAKTRSLRAAIVSSSFNAKLAGSQTRRWEVFRPCFFFPAVDVAGIILATCTGHDIGRIPLRLPWLTSHSIHRKKKGMETPATRNEIPGTYLLLLGAPDIGSDRLHLADAARVQTGSPRKNPGAQLPARRAPRIWSRSVFSA